MLEDANLVEGEGSNGEARTWGTEVTVDGVKYATSLFWQPLQNQDDPYAEVGDAAEGILEGADLFCIKPGKAPQFGICVSTEGFKNGELAGAVALSTALADKSSFVAVFKTDNGWWYICVRNDIILSDGDMLFLNEEDAKNQFMSMLAVPDWGKKIAPAEWGLEDTEQADLGRLLQRGVKAKLQKIKGLRGTKLLLVIGISAVVAFWLLSNVITAMFFTPKKRPVVVPIQPKVVQKQLPPPEKKPWETLKNPEQIMLNCYQKIIILQKVMPPGWEVGDFTCSQSNVATSWKLKIGKLSWGKRALDKSGVNFSFRSVSPTGDTMMAGLTYDNVETISSPPLKTTAQLREILNDFFQSIGQKVTLTDTSYTSPQNNIYRSISFSIDSRYNPKVWSDLLTKFSGLDVKSIKYTTSSGVWHYEGAIYAL